MTEAEFIKFLGKIGATMGTEGEAFVEKLDEIFTMLEETDSDDYFGTEGYRYRLGWD